MPLLDSGALEPRLEHSDGGILSSHLMGFCSVLTRSYREATYQMLAAMELSPIPGFNLDFNL